MLNLLNYDFSVIGLTESRIKKDIGISFPMSIEGYSFVHTPTESSCGGSLLYISDKVNYKPRNDLLIYKSTHLESIFVEIIYPKKTNIIVGCIYKHPCMAIKEFNDFLSPILEQISLENKTVILLGDFNIDLIKCSSDLMTSEFFNLICYYNFLPYITLPTRITERSKTLIDNIFSNSTSNKIISGNLTATISDHLPQFFIYPEFNKKFVPRKHNIYRRNNNYDKASFLKDFKEINWENIITIKDNDTNSSFDSFFQNFTKLLDKHLPLKKMSIKTFKRRFKPWITKGILKSIKKRNELHSRFMRANDIERKNALYQRFKFYRNMLVTLIRKSRQNYFAKYFSENSKKIRETWKGIKNIIQMKNRTDSLPTCILNNKGISISDPLEIANTFNLYFSSIGGDLQSKIHSSHTNFSKYLKNPNVNSLFISPINANEVYDLISNLSNSKASGPNSIPTVVLKHINNEVSIVLSKLFNLSFSTGIFPDMLKISSVLPLFKKGSKLICNNYRPISLLSNISKLLEKLMTIHVYIAF